MQRKAATLETKEVFLSNFGAIFLNKPGCDIWEKFNNLELIWKGTKNYIILQNGVKILLKC